MPVSYAKIRELLADEKEFKGNSMSAYKTPMGTGRLNNKDRGAFYEDHPKITYVVYSYATPIAWRTSEGKTIIPDTKYSSTTSKGQTYCRMYLPKSEITPNGKVNA